MHGIPSLSSDAVPLVFLTFMVLVLAGIAWAVWRERCGLAGWKVGRADGVEFTVSGVANSRPESGKIVPFQCKS